MVVFQIYIFQVKTPLFYKHKLFRKLFLKKKHCWRCFVYQFKRRTRWWRYPLLTRRCTSWKSFSSVICVCGQQNNPPPLYTPPVELNLDPSELIHIPSSGNEIILRIHRLVWRKKGELDFSKVGLHFYKFCSARVAGWCPLNSRKTVCADSEPYARGVLKGEASPQQHFYGWGGGRSFSRLGLEIKKEGTSKKKIYNNNFVSGQFDPLSGSL